MVNRTTTTITFRIHKSAIEAIDMVRAKQTRTRSMQVLHYVLQGLMRDGYSMDELDPRRSDDVRFSEHHSTTPVQ